MRVFWTLFKKEISQFFSAASSYVLLAVFLAMSGFFFYNISSYFAMQCIQALQYQSAYNIPLPPMSVNQWVVRPFFHNLAILAIFLIPIVTMRSYATERAHGTAELLMTSPIRTRQLVSAKFLASLSFYVVLIATTLLFQLILNAYTKAGSTMMTEQPKGFSIFDIIASAFSGRGGLDWGPVWAGYMGLLFVGIATIPIGQFISSLTKNQIIAAFMSFALLLILWIVDWSSLFATGWLSKVIGYIGISPHFSNFARGVIDTSDIIYFVSLTVLGIFLTSQSIESWRWRGA